MSLRKPHFQQTHARTLAARARTRLTHLYMEAMRNETIMACATQ
jgi:hypothetical protein